MKHVRSFDSFKNLKFVKSSLLEVGEANLDGADWSMISEKPRGRSMETNYGFLLGDDEYEVKFTQNMGSDSVDVEFSANGDRDSLTGAGKPLTVMSTVISIIKSHLEERPEIDEIAFVPSMNYDDDRRRLRLYLAYLKKSFPGSRISLERAGPDYTIVHVKL